MGDFFLNIMFDVKIVFCLISIYVTMKEWHSFEAVICRFVIMKKDNNILKNKAHYQNLRDKYLGSAKEAASSGDRVLAEYNLQHAEHYKRIIAEKFQNNVCNDISKNNVIQKVIDEPIKTEEKPVIKENIAVREKPQKKRCVRKQKTELVTDS